MKQLTKIFQALLGIAALICTAVIAFGHTTLRSIKVWWKKRSKKLLRRAITIILLLFAAFIAYALYSKHEHDNRRWYWKDETLSGNIEAHCFYDGKFKIYNKQKGEYTTPKIYWVSKAEEGDSLAVYAIPKKRGYINTKSGAVVIDAASNNYEKAWVFSEGLAAVMKEGKVGFINEKNEIVIPFRHNYSNVCRMNDFGYIFRNGYCAMTNEDGKLGLIDKSGVWVIDPVYDEIWSPMKEEGYRIVITEGKYGVIDGCCSLVRKAEYEHISITDEGFVLTKDGCKWLEDPEGYILQPFMFDNTYWLSYNDGYNEEGECINTLSDYVKYEIRNRYGIMNRITGKVITKAIYHDVNMLSKELFEVQCPCSYDWYAIDAKGNPVDGK